MAFIYKILNNKNGKFYIGSAKDFSKRKYKHIWELNNNRHKNKKLQNAWNKHGADSFEFIILEEVPLYIQFQVEQKYIDKLRPFDDIGYNIATDTFDPLGKTKIRRCKECGEYFISEYRGRIFCSNECEVEYENSDWRRSNYEFKHIDDWDVDDHLAAWYDDMLEK